MKRENQQIFAGTQENMCESARLGINLYNINQPVFEKINLKYNKEWGNQIEEQIVAALAMPDVNSRRAVPSNLRDKLLLLSQPCVDNWLVLGGIIKNVAPANEVESLLVLAGSANLGEAMKYNWPKVKALTAAGADFINGNMELLLNGGQGMSPDFPKTFTDAQAAFEKGMSNFYDAKQDMPSETLTKVDAMNNVYITLQGMLSDGRIIFRRDKAKKSNFSYTRLLAKVQGAGKPSGYRFTLQLDELLTPVTSATVMLIPTGATYSADDQGIIQFVQKAGVYKYTITSPGLQTTSGVITIKPNSIGRKKLILKKAAAGTGTTDIAV